MRKIAAALLWIFAYGVTICFFAGALSFVGYVVALVIGGETATAMCIWIHKTYFPWVIKFTSAFAAFGLAGMYLNKVKTLTVGEDKK